jgi:ribosomal protein RSM22 (predicted rRNA methylase)
LQAGIDRELTQLDRSHVSRAAPQITTDYKSGRFSSSLDSADARAAYLVTRLPATFAASQYVFREIQRLVPEFRPASILDLGAGPGTASWAALDVWPNMAQITLVDSNRSMLEVGKRLSSAHDALKDADWQNRDLRFGDFAPSDLVVLSYALGELADPPSVVSAAWSAAQHVLVIVEPGTPANFARVAQVRRELIAAEANIVAPCPHTDECPMWLAHDWCHFAVRVERTSEHRKMKGGALGYEDEKFSYLAFSKNPVVPARARVVRHPLIHSGHIQLTLCELPGLSKRTITRSDKEAFRSARKTKWGDEWSQLE